MIACPGCGEIAPDKTFPWISMSHDDDDLAWWCSACLAARVAAAHAADCRCERCTA